MNLRCVSEVALVGVVHVSDVGVGKSKRGISMRSCKIFVHEILISPIHWCSWTAYKIRCAV